MGRPRVIVRRAYLDFPAPTPQKTWCRLWQGAVDSDGYGVLTTHQTREKKAAHRWVWEMAYGPIIPGLVVRHKCDNRLCFRLSHLELGTVADNNRDASERGHLGVRAMSPSEVVAVWNRHEAGESYKKIAADYPNYSLATVKRVKEYIVECLELTTGSPNGSPATSPIPSDADATPAPPHGVATTEGTTTSPPTSPPSS